MWHLIFSLLVVSLILFQQDFVHVSYGQLTIVSITTKVEAGRGNKIAPLNHFKPEKVEVQVNETVEWHNPTTGIAYPHTVTFIGGRNVSVLQGMPANISKSSSFDTLSLLGIMQKNLENRTLSNLSGTDNNKILLNTSELIYPSVINSSINRASYLNSASSSGYDGAKYTMNGTVKYLNSGLIFPGDNIPPNFPPISTFAVKFLTTGVYHYQCMIHPEMAGAINVIPISNSHH